MKESDDMTVLYFMIILAVIIFIHELGHMLAAKLFGCYVSEFAIGFGPAIFQKQGKETKYTLRAIPLGGFTGMVESENTPIRFDDEGNPTEFLTVPKKRTFYGIRIWQRIVVLLAGPVFNLILACLVYVVAFQINGYIVDPAKPVIKTVVVDSPAYEAGLRDGDYVKQVVLSDGQKFSPGTFTEMVLKIQNNTDEMKFTIERNGSEVVLRVTPKYDENEKRYMIGIISADPEVRKLNFLQAIPEGFKYGIESISLTAQSIIGLFTGAQKLDSIGGTISIYKYTEEAASLGFVSVLSLLAALSISVGLMNLMPIPIFDGGKIVLACAEKVAGHRLSEKVETTMTVIGLGLVFLLFIVATYQDILRFFING